MAIHELLIPAASSAAAGYLAYQGQDKANVFNLRIAREQMAFQERMSSSAYQRSMDDMKAAGLNPMLAFGQGPAATPGGASATMESAIGEGVASAKSARRLTSELKSMKSGRRLQENQALLARNAAAREASVTAKTMLESDLVDLQKRILSLQLPALENSAKVEKSPLGPKAAIADRLRQAVMGGRGFFNPVGG